MTTFLKVYSEELYLKGEPISTIFPSKNEVDELYARKTDISNSNALNQEILDRKAGDSLLQTQIDDRVTQAQLADTLIASKAYVDNNFDLLVNDERVEPQSEVMVITPSGTLNIPGSLTVGGKAVALDDKLFDYVTMEEFNTVIENIGGSSGDGSSISIDQSNHVIMLLEYVQNIFVSLSIEIPEVLTQTINSFNNSPGKISLTQLKTDITTILNSLNSYALKSDLDQEVSDRIQAITGIQADIDIEKARIDQIEEDYALKTIVDAKINIEKARIDQIQEDYALKTIVDAKINIEKARIDQIEDEYALKSEIPTIPDHSQYALKSEIPTIPDHSQYALKSELPTIPDHSQYALKSELPTIPDQSVYALKTEIPTIPDHSQYALKSELPTIPDHSQYALKTEIPDHSQYALKNEIPNIPDHSQYALKTEIPDHSQYALKTEIPTIPDQSVYALKTEIPTIPDHSQYALKTEIPTIPDQSVYALKTEIPDHSQYALKTEIPTIPDHSQYALKTEIPTIPDHSQYALKTEIPDHSQYALKTEIPTIPDHSQYALKTEIPTIPDHSQYATKTEVDSKIFEKIEDWRTDKSLPVIWASPTEITLNTTGEGQIVKSVGPYYKGDNKLATEEVVDTKISSKIIDLRSDKALTPLLVTDVGLLTNGPGAPSDRWGKVVTEVYLNNEIDFAITSRILVDALNDGVPVMSKSGFGLTLNTNVGVSSGAPFFSAGKKLATEEYCNTNMPLWDHVSILDTRTDKSAGPSFGLSTTDNGSFITVQSSAGDPRTLATEEYCDSKLEDYFADGRTDKTQNRIGLHDLGGISLLTTKGVFSDSYYYQNINGSGLKKLSTEEYCDTKFNEIDADIRLKIDDIRTIKGPANILGLSDYGIHMTTLNGVYSEAPYYQNIDSAYKKVATEVDINALHARIDAQQATINNLSNLIQNLDPTGFGNLFGLL